MPKTKVKKIIEAGEYGMIVELDVKRGQPIKYPSGRMMIPMFPVHIAVYRENLEDYEFPPHLAAKIPAYLRRPNA